MTMWARYVLKMMRDATLNANPRSKGLFLMGPRLYCQM